MQRFWVLLRTLLYGWVFAISELLARLRRALRRRQRHGRDERERRTTRARCVPIDHSAFVRPDPLIYSQYYLMSLGLAVTWDNPDIQLWRGGVPVSSSLLEPDTEYKVIARIWNASTDAPVVQMPVHFSYLDFGIGTISVPISSTVVDVGVKGSASSPAFAAVVWRTPSQPGHYCLQVHLDPIDDLNFANNLGQENTNVGHATSPATFTFKLSNNTPEKHQYRFQADGYSIPPVDPCDGSLTTEGRLERHRSSQYQLPPSWTIVINPSTAALLPGNEITIAVSITPSDAWSGTQPVNINAYNEDGPAGGVTLVVEKGL